MALPLKLRRLADAPPLIREMRPFVNRAPAGCEPSISGDIYHPHGFYGFGNLPNRYSGSVRSASYVIKSYATPIAWFATIPHDIDPLPFLLGDQAGQWVVPDVSYSMTTNGHQALVQAALGGWSGPGHRQPAIPYSTGWGGRIRVPSGGDYR